MLSAEDVDMIKTIAIGTGSGVTATGLLTLFLRRIKRTDHKEDLVDTSWEAIVRGLREEMKRMHADQSRMHARLIALETRIKACDEERADLMSLVQAFERRYGTRRDDEHRTSVMEVV